MPLAAEPLPPEGFRALLEEAVPRFRVDLNELQRDRIARFLTELDRWRRTVNLTGRLSSEELVSHALESTCGCGLLPPGSRVVDIGTGGGFPGVPLALCRPDLSVTWLEPREKRAAFLRHLTRALPVENAVVRVGRAEDLPASSFDFATSRAIRIETLKAGRFLQPRGGLLLWTTDSTGVPSGFQRESTLSIPGSRHRVIALFRRA
jgi:16S rRNA (guanine527-N7)-methyltransferase